MKIYRKDIKSIVSEAIDELKRFSASQPQAAQQQAATAAPKESKDAKSPTARVAFYEDDANGNSMLHVILQWIHDQHQSQLMNKWAQDYPGLFTVQRRPSSVKGEPAPIELIIPESKEQDFEKIVPNLVSDISAMNGVGRPPFNAYKQSALASLDKSIIGRINTAASKDDFEKAEQRIIDNWGDLLTKLQDPAVMKKMGLIGGIVNMTQSPVLTNGGIAASHQLSQKNKMEVYAQLPNATFVTDEWTWEHMFNRTIIDKTQFAIIQRPKNNKKTNIQALAKSAERNGYKAQGSLSSLDVFKDLARNGKLSQNQIWAVKSLSNMLNPDPANFFSAKVYDVSNTQLIPGMKDVWNDEANFSDNLQGIPNSVAQAQDASNIKVSGAAVPSNPQVSPGKCSVDELAAIVDIMKSLCIRDCGTAPNQVGGSLGDIIAHYVHFYAMKYVIPSKNNVKPENQEAIAQGLSVAIAATYDIETPKGAAYLQKLLSARDNDKSLRTAIYVCFMEYRDLVDDINKELLKISRKMVKSRNAAQPSTAVAEDAQVPVQGEEFNIPQPMNFEEFKEVIGAENIDNSAQDDTLQQVPVNQPDEQEMDSEIDPQQIKESFFKFLDKMERIDG